MPFPFKLNSLTKYIWPSQVFQSFFPNTDYNAYLNDIFIIKILMRFLLKG